MTTKFCPKCKADKEFGPNKARPNGLQVWCKDCMRNHRKSKRQERSVYSQQYRGANSKSIKQRQRLWKQGNKDHTRQYYDSYFQTPRGRAAKLIGEIKRRCKNNGMPFSISSEDILPALENGICEATGIKLDFLTVGGPFSPSVDRIDCQRGYEIGNIQIVVLMYNLAKRKWSHDDVITMATAIIDFSKIKR